MEAETTESETVFLLAFCEKVYSHFTLKVVYLKCKTRYDLFLLLSLFLLYESEKSSPFNDF